MTDCGQDHSQDGGRDGEEYEGGVSQVLAQEGQDDQVGRDGADRPDDGDVGILGHVHPILDPEEQVPERSLATSGEVEDGESQEDDQDLWSVAGVSGSQ